jgi:hypothetical protein
MPPDFEEQAHFRASAGARTVFQCLQDLVLRWGHLAFARPLFLLAVGFCVDVVLPALTIAKLIRDVGSFPLPLTFGRFHD